MGATDDHKTNAIEIYDVLISFFKLIAELKRKGNINIDNTPQFREIFHFLNEYIRLQELMGLGAGITITY